MTILVIMAVTRRMSTRNRISKVNTEELSSESKSVAEALSGDFKCATSEKLRKPSTFRSNKRKHLTVQYEEKNSSTGNNDSAINNSEWKPKNWTNILDNIIEMRKHRDAPVDSMGAEKCMDKEANPKVSRYHTLVSLMLSSQTKDAVTYAAMQNLIKHGLTVESICEIEEALLGKLIYPVGFWKSKVKHIKKTAEILKEKYNGDIPSTVTELCELPGVGPKMAHLCMDIAWGELTGIGVDTHVHRISNRLGWVKTPTKTPEATRLGLESWLPRDHWREVNLLLVGFGQQICTPVNPKCSLCLNQEICPSAEVNKSKKKRSPKKKELCYSNIFNFP